jgi:threonine dehydratase
MTVTDERILEATALVVKSMRVVVEPSAAVGVAALLEHPDLRASRAPTGVLLSGSNVRWPLLADLLRG